MKRHSPLLALLFSVLFACSSSPKTDSSLGAPGTATGKSSNLTRETAMWRSRQPHKIRYSVWLGLDEESKEFRGRTKVKFELREHAFRKKKKLRLDFTGGNVTTLIVNGNQWTPEKTAEVYNGEWFEFDRGDLS